MEETHGVCHRNKVRPQQVGEGVRVRWGDLETAGTDTAL